MYFDETERRFEAQRGFPASSLVSEEGADVTRLDDTAPIFGRSIPRHLGPAGPRKQARRGSSAVDESPADC